MRPIVIVLIATAPLIYWLLKRVAKSRADKPNQGLAPSDITSEEISQPVSSLTNPIIIPSPHFVDEVHLAVGDSEFRDHSSNLESIATMPDYDGSVDAGGQLAETVSLDADHLLTSEPLPEKVEDALPRSDSEGRQLLSLAGATVISDNASAGSQFSAEDGQIFKDPSASAATREIVLTEDELSAGSDVANFTLPTFEEEPSSLSSDTDEFVYREHAAEVELTPSRGLPPPYSPSQDPSVLERENGLDQVLEVPVLETQVVEVFEAVSITDVLDPEDETATTEDDDYKETIDREGHAKAPSRYRPPTQRPAKRTMVRTAPQEQKSVATSIAALEIRVRATFDRFGFISMIGLLPARPAGLDAELDVRVGDVTRRLVAQEEWYQDLEIENIGQVLQEGIEVRGRSEDQRQVRWQLKGRDVYVLASHPLASGFVSTSRLALGRSHFVLCLMNSLQQVEVILNEAGCNEYSKIDESYGVPNGWVGLRNVTPTKAIPVLGFDPFYAIKPAPDMEIDLEGGIRLRNSVWLAGYPPRIKLFGPSNETARVLIDEQIAALTQDATFETETYASVGPHNIYCEGFSCSRSYSIEEPPDSWEQWSAYRFGRANICGPLVEPTAGVSGRRIISVPMSNPLLIGAEPGQIFWCSPRSVFRWKGFVPFDVVWALPAHPHICDKKSARILHFGNIQVAAWKPHKQIPRVWCDAILDASRKGLRIENGSTNSIAHWREYKKLARSIRRRVR